MGQLPDGLDAEPCQMLRGPRAHAEHFMGGAGPERVHGGLVQLKDAVLILLGEIVAGQLGKNLVAPDADSGINAGLAPHPHLNMPGELLRRAAKVRQACRHIDELLINAERLHEIGIGFENAHDLQGYPDIGAHARFHHDQIGAFLLGLPQGLRRGDPVILRKRACRENDAASPGRVAGDDQGSVLVCGIRRFFNRGIKGLAVRQKTTRCLRLCMMIPPIRDECEMFQPDAFEYRPSQNPTSAPCHAGSRDIGSGW